MLIELAVRDLGVIADLRLTLGPGMTALTGETGAGKTMLVEAIDLLLGGRADSSRVRPGAPEAVVEGLFLADDREVVLRRVVPSSGRSRSYVDGAMATTAELARLGGSMVEVHGQHSQQGLTRPARQRDALDRFAGIDLAPWQAARDRVADLTARLDALGGDERSRARELDVLRYQLDELAAAGLDDPDEDAVLDVRESGLADAVAHREAAGTTVELLTGEGGALEGLAAAAAALEGRAPFEELHRRLVGSLAELTDVATETRAAGEATQDDPEALATVRARRQLLGELRRKYGETLAEVIAERDAVAARFDELGSHEARAAELTEELGRARRELEAAEADLARRRADGAVALGAAIEREATGVALDGARVEVAAEGVAGSEVEVRVATNRGMPLGPVARVASGGELSRVMLALHLVLSAGPSTMVFDEVDAGLGGETARGVGLALAQLAVGRQVLVVTHLPQVAAFADQQVSVHKHDDGRTTSTAVTVLGSDDRVVELARMLSGSPDSAAAHAHAGELLATAASERAHAPTGTGA